MPAWRFIDYITASGINPVIDWCGKYLNNSEKAIFDLLVLELSETLDWDAVKPKKRKYKELERDHVGLTQLMFEAEGKYLGNYVKKQFRALGILKRIQCEFIFLGGCEKHGFLGTTPPDAFKKALALKAQFEQGQGTLNDHPI